jgi:hypothetical protein
VARRSLPHRSAVARVKSGTRFAALSCGDSTLEKLLALVDRRRDELQQQAFALGQRFYRERPREFSRLLKGYWTTWRAEQITAARC